MLEIAGKESCDRPLGYKMMSISKGLVTKASSSQSYTDLWCSKSMIYTGFLQVN